MCEDARLSANAARLLQRLLQAADAAERTGSVIEIQVVQGLVQQARRHAEAVLAPLQRAMILAEPEGYVRVFVGHGRPMASLLGGLAQQRKPGDYVHACCSPVANLHPFLLGPFPRRSPHRSVE